MKKKLLSLLLCTSMLATLAAGCGSKAKEADKPKEGEPTTLTMWLPPLDEDTEGNFKKLLAGWEKENNCTVEMEIIPWGSYEERWSTGVEVEKHLISVICMWKCILLISLPDL